MRTAAYRKEALSWQVQLRDCLELTKPEVTFLILIATLAGFYMGMRGDLDGLLLAHTLLGTALVAGGTGTLNQYIERHRDAQMRRTAQRPLPSGRMAPAAALRFGLGLAILGSGYLYLLVNPLSSLLAFLTLASYLLLYTPLKTRTHFCTLVGAFPGAMPPLIGWAAARNQLSTEAWILYAILFCWQFPHFLAIAWMYREDYARGGIIMLPGIDPSGKATFQQIVLVTGVLIPVSVLPSLLGLTGTFYLAGALLLGLAFWATGLWSARHKTIRSARYLLHASVIHLPILIALLMLDKRIQPTG